MSIPITKESIKRLIKDVKQINNEPLHDQGIYYKHDEEDILKGHALIIGPSDTPYDNGYYFFEFNFPSDYPFSPPRLTYLTQDGITRFNPNLYRSGKVCLSLLNTWRGEQWTSCQTISSILLTLITVFNNKPLLNEPGVTECHNDFEKYNMILTYKNYETAIYDIVNNEKNQLFVDKFYDEVMENFKSNFKSIKKKVMALNKKTNKQKLLVSTTIYTMKASIDYNNINNKLNNLYKNI
jgi:ubiquitin-conjugating enzyme E2 Z